MKQTTLLNNKHFLTSRSEKHKDSAGKTINVDRVPVYEINDSNKNIKSFDLEPLEAGKQIYTKATR